MTTGDARSHGRGHGPQDGAQWRGQCQAELRQREGAEGEPAQQVLRRLSGRRLQVRQERRHDIQDNDIQHNHIQHNHIQYNYIQHNGIQHNDIQLNDIQHNHIQHNDNQHDDTKHYSRYIATLMKMALYIVCYAEGRLC
jgi:hypothetical protein